MKLKGKITHIGEIQSSTNEKGDWKKVIFILSNYEGYQNSEQIFAFEVFGAKRVDNFIKYNKLNEDVEVSFNIKTNEYNGKFYTKLQAWQIIHQDNSVKEKDFF